MRAAPFLLLLASLLSLALSQEPPPLLPPYPPTWDTSASTAVMICNYSGYQTADSTQKWGIVDYDWSNSLADWSAATPMDTNERLMVQAAATTAAQPNTRVWIYRNSVYGYPWYNTVRFILDDPTYRCVKERAGDGAHSAGVHRAQWHVFPTGAPTSNQPPHPPPPPHTLSPWFIKFKPQPPYYSPQVSSCACLWSAITPGPPQMPR